MTSEPRVTFFQLLKICWASRLIFLVSAILGVGIGTTFHFTSDKEIVSDINIDVRSGFRSFDQELLILLQHEFYSEKSFGSWKKQSDFKGLTFDGLTNVVHSPHGVYLDAAANRTVFFKDSHTLRILSEDHEVIQGLVSYLSFLNIKIARNVRKNLGEIVSESNPEIYQFINAIGLKDTNIVSVLSPFIFSSDAAEIFKISHPTIPKNAGPGLRIILLMSLIISAGAALVVVLVNQLIQSDQ